MSIDELGDDEIDKDVDHPMKVTLRSGAGADPVLGAYRAKVFGALFSRPPLRRLGRYVVLDVIGEGGMGTVLKGYDDELDRPVALKVLHRHLSEQDTVRLRREAQAMAKLSHPNVVHVYEVGELEDQTFVAMELVEGQTVRAWLHQEPRPGWKACVELFLQLGAGLAAAHQRGLVHRDFKPGNAIVDEEGRARVLDFGLARWKDRPDDREGDGSTPTPRACTTPLRAASPEAPLTETGTVVGTPAYMPPEQMSGAEADARSDQFSFCVALYEAVYGERPFEGNTLAKLWVSVESGVVRPAPRGSRVPVALRRILTRGLAREPSQRWPSMEALLAALRRQVVPRGRWWGAIAVGVGLMTIGGGVGATRTLEWLNRCTGARQQLEAAWGESRRAAVKAAILGTELSYAPGTWERVEPRLDAYAEAWIAEHTDACEATRARVEQTEEAMALRMGCLRERRQHLRATVDQLAHADADVVEHAVRAVAELPGLEHCRDLEALAAEVPPPEDAAVAQRVTALGDRLAEVRAKLDTGKHQEGLRLVDEIIEEAAPLDYEPLMARAWLLQGILRNRRKDHQGAAEALRRAHRVALVHGMTFEAAGASAHLVHVVGTGLARPEQGRVWAEQAEPLARAVGTDAAYATYLHNLGLTASTEGKYEESRELHEQALSRLEAQGSDPTKVGVALLSLGNVALRQGAHDRARGSYERARALLEDAVGPDHPLLAHVLSNLGIVAATLGEHDRARGFYERALVIFEEAEGPDTPNVAFTLGSLGNLANSQGRYEDARGFYERALAIMEAAQGPDHPDVALALINLGVVAKKQGRYEQARGFYERALAIMEAAQGPDHPDLAYPLDNLGSVVQAQGRHERARGLHERALAIREKALGPDHPQVAASLNNLGNVAFSQGQYEDARGLYERALAVWEQALGPDHPRLALSLNNLGNVAQGQERYERARGFYERALAVWEQALGPDHPDVSYPLAGLGELSLALDEPAEALAPLERALAIRTAHPLAPVELAETRALLARALWAAPASHGRDRARARTLAEDARDAYAAAGTASAPRLAELETWLARHRAP